MEMRHFAGSLLTTLVLSCGIAHADTVSVNGGTVHFKGELVNAACAVSTTSDNQIVELGQYRTAKFTKVGDTSTAIPFSIVLNDCDSDVAETASVSFSGQSAESNPGLLAINAGNATAAGGVGIEILDRTSTPLPPNGTTFSGAQTLNNGVNVLPFSARYKATAATVTAGQANADATFIMKYE